MTALFFSPVTDTLSGQKDPPVRRDGRCGRPGCSKLRPIARPVNTAADQKAQKRLRAYAGAQAETDPFCSTRCCQLFHGVQTRDSSVGDEEIERRERAGRKARANMDRVRGATGGDPVLA